MAFLPKNKKNAQLHRVFFFVAVMGALLGAGSHSARAENTFLVQFGSFNTQKQATQKWDEVQAKEKDLLGKLTLHVAEVKQTADNTTMYRTQTGPFASHAEAAALCGKLQSKGVECYVVETALFTTDKPTLEAKAADDAAKEKLAKALTPSQEVPPAPPALTPQLESGAVPIIEVPAKTADAAKPTELPAPTLLPLPGTSAPAPIEPKVVVTAPVPEAVAPVVVAPAPVVAAKTPVAPEVKATPAPNPLHVLHLPASHAEDKVPAPVLKVEESAAPVLPLKAAKAATAVAPGEVTMVPGREPKFLSVPASKETAQASQLPAPVIYASDEPATAPVVNVQEGERPGFFGRLFGASSAPKAAPRSNVEGKVNVAEAIRVPLGSGKPFVVPNLPPVHGLGGLPSQPMHKTLWVQLGYFPDAALARSFYEEFRASYPQFSDGVRVRITQPYANGGGHVSLRVGPFESAGDVTIICTAASKRNLQCGAVADLGSSVSANLVRTHDEPYNHPINETANETASASAEPTASAHWLQLGSFHSQDEAQDEWKALQNEHRKLLGRLHSDISSPTASSASHATYRLRAGPFMNETAANSLCDKLSGLGVDCLVVDAQ